MKDNDQVIKEGKLPATHGQSRLSSYNFLLRMSKRMGVVATRSFVEVRQFLNQDITITPSERFMAGVSRIRSQKSESRIVNTQNGHTSAIDESSGSPKEAAKRQSDKDKEKDVSEGKSTVDTASEDLEKMINQSHEVLAEASTVFPVTLFPDTVVVDRTKVTIIKRDFFWSSDTMTFRIEDVLNAEVTVGPLFGSLIIASRVMSTTDHFRIDHFWRNDAVYLRRIIQGYVIAQHNKIDVAHLSKDDLVKTLNELGHHRS